MNLTLLDGRRATDATAWLVNVNDKNVLVDCGARIDPVTGEQTVSYLDALPPLDLILLTHAHLHSMAGLFSLFIKQGSLPPVVTTQPTAELIKLLFLDSGEHGHEEIPSHVPELTRKVLSNLLIMQPGQLVKPFDDDSVQCFGQPTGHALGAMAVQLRNPKTKQNILFLGDAALDGGLAHPDLALTGLKSQTVVLDAQCSNTVHPLRNEQMQEFILEIEHCLKEGGSVLIPVSYLGLAQEMLHLLANKGRQYPNISRAPIWLDGMVALVSSLYVRYKAIPVIENLQAVGLEDRAELGKRSGQIIICSPPSLVRGSAAEYARFLVAEERNKILLPEHSDAEYSEALARLKQGDITPIGKSPIRIGAQVGRYRLSNRMDAVQLVEVIRDLNPDRVVLYQLGEELGDSFRDVLEEKAVNLPANGETVDLLEEAKPKPTRRKKHTTGNGTEKKADALPSVESRDDLIARLPKLQQTLGLRFKNVQLLLRALTQPSVMQHLEEGETPEAGDMKTAKTMPSSYRMAFVGKGVVDLTLREALYRRLPKYQEGALVALEASLLTDESLDQIAERLQLGQFIWTSKEVAFKLDKNVPQRKRLLRMVLLAIIGAAFLDRGLEAAQVLIDTHIMQSASELVGRLNSLPAKDPLIRYYEERSGVTPSLRAQQEGRTWQVEVVIDDQVIASAQAKSRADAEEKACRQALNVCVEIS